VGFRLYSVLLVVLAAAVGCGDQETGGEAKSHPPLSASEDVLSRDPYMGVSCPEPNSFACDRIGLAVWLREPAERVDAVVEGREFGLDDPEWSEPAEHGQRRMFAGFLQPAGLVDGPLALTPDDGPDRWIGREPVSATVELRITRADGSVGETSTEVPLSAGWG
jgi:hypothetical protein